MTMKTAVHCVTFDNETLAPRFAINLTEVRRDAEAAARMGYEAVVERIEVEGSASNVVMALHVFEGLQHLQSTQDVHVSRTLVETHRPTEHLTFPPGTEAWAVEVVKPEGD